MSDVTCCPLSSRHDGDGAEFSSHAIVTARKQHKCFECGEAINKGSKYEVYSGVWDGTPSRFKTCMSCVEIRDHFACEGWIFGELWNDLEDNLFPDMKAGGPCMEGLSTEAKARLFERRMEWLLS